MHSKIKTAQSHEIWHFDMIDRGTMVSFLIGDHKFASLGRVTRPASRTLSAIYRHAILDQGDPLQGQRNFEAQPIRRWSTAEENLCGAPVTRLCGNIQCGHLIPARQSVPGGSGIEQSAQVLVLPKCSSEHDQG